MNLIKTMSQEIRFYTEAEIKPDPVKDRHIVFDHLEQARKDFKSLLGVDLGKLNYMIYSKTTEPDSVKVAAMIINGTKVFRGAATASTFYKASVGASKKLLMELTRVNLITKKC